MLRGLGLEGARQANAAQTWHTSLCMRLRCGRAVPVRWFVATATTRLRARRPLPLCGAHCYRLLRTL